MVCLYKCDQTPNYTDITVVANMMKCNKKFHTQ